MKTKPIYGLLAEFDQPEQLLEAARKAHAAGYERIDAFTPMPIEGLAEACGFRRTKIAPITLAGGIFGCFGGFGIQYYASVINYPLNIGGRPYNSWPAFIPITFEMTVLFAAIACVGGLLVLNGLPSPYHPVFNVPRFALASRNRFFLCVKARDKRFDLAGTRNFLESLNSVGVYDIET
ncbi:MAG TPA: DUF3341 domain-containing protein [Candidatus Acidoferrales bacterium]|nr:DUF3341 domain-containing protein [Candidatus Acidoferrales bacterium]